MLPGPFLLLMAFDPIMPIMEAFTSGRAQITHIPALASTNVVIHPQYRVGWGSKPYYYYSEFGHNARKSTVRLLMARS